jgi:hypothetical protein
MEKTLVDTDPVVVQVHNEDSDRIHTVVPQSVHCSCEDHTYRGAICKHIIDLLGTDGHSENLPDSPQAVSQSSTDVGDLMRGYLKEHRADLESEANETRDRLDDLLFQCKQITGVLSELDIDQDMEQTDEAGMRLLQEGAEVGDAAIVEDNPTDLTDDEARSEFESMVADLTEGQ